MFDITFDDDFDGGDFDENCIALSINVQAPDFGSPTAAYRTYCLYDTADDARAALATGIEGEWLLLGRSDEGFGVIVLENPDATPRLIDNRSSKLPLGWLSIDDILDCVPGE